MNVTVPLVRVRFADSPGVGGGGRKSAVTEVEAPIVTMHAPLPVHAPLQPPNVQPASGWAVSVTGVPVTKSALHVAPQSMCVCVDDVDAHCAHAREHGARIFREPKTDDYGEEYGAHRTYGAIDPEGHHWWFMQGIRDAKPSGK